MRFSTLSFLAFGLLAVTGSAPLPAQRVVSERVEVRVRQTSVRVPIRPMSTRQVPVEWREGKGPKCLGRIQLAGAQLSKPGAIDLILRDRRRVRAELEKRCMRLDLYRGFYVRPTDDGRVCADRDAIHARSGGECGIKRFRLLTAR